MSSRSRRKEEKRLRKEEKKRLKQEEKRRRKKEMRMLETPEQRAQRKKSEKAAKVSSYFGYTNEENPFGDSNLHQQFVWRKKIDKEIGSGKMKQEPSKTQSKRKREKLVEEINKVKQRRKEREEEREEFERLRVEEARLREQETYGDWQKKEDEFHLEQARERSKIRIKEGREKPVDVLAKNILLFSDSKGELASDPVMELELKEPYKIFIGLPYAELEELHGDISQYVQLEGEGPNQAFWQALLVLSEHEVTAARARGDALGLLDGGDAPAAISTGIHGAIEDSVNDMFKGKSTGELDELAGLVEAQLSSGSAGVDVEYWEGVRQQLTLHRARAVLKSIHTRMLLKQLQFLEKRKALASGGGAGAGAGGGSGSGASRSKASDGGDDAAATADGDGEGDDDDTGRYSPVLISAEEAAEVAGGADDAAQGEDGNDGSFSPELLPLGGEDDGSFSPLLLADDDEDATAAAATGGGGGGTAAVAASSRMVDPEEDLRQLTQQRHAILEREQRKRAAAVAASRVGIVTNAAPASSVALSRVAGPARAGGSRGGGGGGGGGNSAADDAMYRREAAKGMAADEEALADLALPQQVYWWHDKYRPRKPRYFNRVKTGYEWNDYNKTHYDHDNPPPKTVQGYKFNIFYPDLIDRSKTPSFTLESADSREFCILRFTAGPPYEDIAFKIVNQEWAHGRKRGFKSVFERGILHLYFNFKRHRYRR